MAANRTPSAKLNTLIARAEALGLVVEVEDISSNLFETYYATVRRPEVQAQNALDQYNNSRRIWLYVSRYVGSGNRAKAFSISGSTYSMSGQVTKIRRVGTIPFAIDGLAE